MRSEHFSYFGNILDPVMLVLGIVWSRAHTCKDRSTLGFSCALPYWKVTHLADQLLTYVKG